MPRQLSFLWPDWIIRIKTRAEIFLKIWIEDLCVRSRHQGQGQVITAHIPSKTNGPSVMNIFVTGKTETRFIVIFFFIKLIMRVSFILFQFSSCYWTNPVFHNNTSATKPHWNGIAETLVCPILFQGLDYEAFWYFAQVKTGTLCKITGHVD